MGLIRASVITTIVFFIWKVVFDRLLPNIPDSMRCKVSPWVPMVTVFIIETLL